MINLLFTLELFFYKILNESILQNDCLLLEKLLISSSPKSLQSNSLSNGYSLSFSMIFT